MGVLPAVFRAELPGPGRPAPAGGSRLALGATRRSARSAAQGLEAPAGAGTLAAAAKTADRYKQQMTYAPRTAVSMVSTSNPDARVSDPGRRVWPPGKAQGWNPTGPIPAAPMANGRME